MQIIDTIQPKLQQLIWLNRNSQKKVLANSKRASNGALIVNQTLIPSGLPLLLGTKDSGLDRDDFEALQAHNASVLSPFTLQFGTTSTQVIWDNTGEAAVSGDDLFDQVDGDDLVTNVVLRFLTV
ncbi:hypothetical protein [Shewanella sp. MBTL60-007]|uniref:hypothetical protein n=1 Tax=Shewanella sp. MBTL60-007 TaxID=2815911 RepID=UPI001BB88CC5|nr:hypothetical protein [Shewanella sp. MBTL60-007]GIU22251.1 hypothetical protein TUM3792_24150 [Shewanella sp. MBTL60-007]